MNDIQKLKVKEMKELVNKLNYYRNLYYNKNTQEISDYEYDNLFDKLQELENETGIIMSNSPTQNVGYEVKSKLQKVKHSHPMLSLAKTKDINELIKFSGNQDCILSCKLDGLTTLLTYENGKFVQAETRGDGEYGELITHNARVFENIPLTIPATGHIEFEGESIITYNDFEKINSELPEDKKYKNPRNLVSGSVRQLDSKIASNRHIKFVVWKVPQEFTDYYLDGFKFAKKMGFDIVPFLTYYLDKENIEKMIESLKEKANILSYPIDGLVMTYNNIEYGKSLGMTGHHPKHSIAFKFYNEEYETTLKSIEWSLGKTGQITPVAVFEPVDIDGSIVEKASLSNLSIMEDTLGCLPFVGQTLYITKRNEVIPKVERADILIQKNDSLKSLCDLFTIPNKCPVCGQKTEVQQDNNSKILICTNPKCKGKLLAKLKHFVSKSAMNIDGLSEQTLSFLIDKGWVCAFQDLYCLGYCNEGLNDIISKWKRSEGFGDKSVDKILNSIDKSRITTLDRFINALSIPLVGKEASKLIAKDCNYDINIFLERLYMVLFNSDYDWQSIDGIGYVVSDNINKYAMNNFDDVESLSKYMNFDKPVENKINSSIKNMVFVITGSLSVFKNRDEAKEKIETSGGKVSSSVSNKTNYLVNNDINSNSSKNKKAKELGIPIITEDELLNMLKQ